MKKIFLAALILVLSGIFANRGWAQCSMGGSGGDHQHSPKQHSEHQKPKMSHGTVKSYTVDGYQVSFNIMEKNEFLEMTKAMDDGDVARHEELMAGKTATHHVMVVIIDGETGERLESIPLKLKLVKPADKVETKPWGWMDTHYCGYLTLEKPGEYVVLASFKADGQDHSVGFTYELKDEKN